MSRRVRRLLLLATALAGTALALGSTLQGCGGCVSQARANGVVVTPTAACLGLTIGDADGKVLSCGSAISVRGHDDCNQVFSISSSPVQDGRAAGDGGAAFTNVFQPGEAIEFSVVDTQAATAADGTLRWTLPAQLGDAGAQVVITLGPQT